MDRAADKIGNMDPPDIIWTARPYPGLAWRPQDLSITTMAVLFAAFVVFMTISQGSSWFFTIIALLLSGYLLLGRFHHDAHLRRRIRYELSSRHLTVWVDGRDVPECVIELLHLRDVAPQFVTGSGRGTIELPPGGWAAEPEWMNRWDRDVPAMYPCRRLELVDDVRAVADMIRRKAREDPHRVAAVEKARGLR